ncbi:phage major capsid protein [Clostridium botulinum]|nr:phage major capsid protein [Clostridium botulinum]NFP31026.1 phage major capsid protein [Clostridium botulinum]
MKVEERNLQIKNLTAGLRKFVEANDLEGAKAKRDELRQAKEFLEIEKEQEEEEKRELEEKNKRLKHKTNEERKTTYDEEVRAVARVIMGKANNEERELVKASDNTAIIPTEFINQMEVYRKGFPSLKQYCHVIPVSREAGSMPCATLGINTLSNLTEGEDIAEGTAGTDEIKYSVDDYGKLVPVSNKLLEDEVISIVDNVIKPDFAEASVTKENTEIITIVKEAAKKLTGTSHTDIAMAMDMSLPSVKAGLVTITNSTGYAYLKNKTDATGRPLNLITVINGVECFNSKPIIALDDTDIKPEAEGNMIFYIANLKELIKFFDRKLLTIDMSKEFLFGKNQTAIRAIERFDAVKGNERSAKVIEITVG